MLDGHLVQGHVDYTSKILRKRLLPDNSFLIDFELPKGYAHYFIEKGSVAVDGISLTVAALEPEYFTIAIIPHTAKCTTLGFKEVGDPVNIEVDMIAKHLERLAQCRPLEMQETR